jgi:cell wall assembly regulator SMI1
MQKFTRALTREVEVGGERLALTFSAEGVSVRPVGSRRPPHSLDWAGVVCACAGKTPAGGAATAEEVSAALAVLHEGAHSPKPVKPSASEPAAAMAPAPAAEVPELLARLDAWLARHRPRYHEALLPPAGEGELSALAQALGQPLPQELRQWLTWHNGQSEDLIGSFYETFNLMSAAQIAAAWQDRQANPEPGWSNARVPLLDDYQGDLILLDPAQPGCAVREAWRGRQEYSVVAPTLAAWLRAFVNDVEAGRFHEDPERGEFRRA